MVLPEKVVGYNKKRDAEICNLWLDELMDYKEIAERFEITERRVHQILVANNASIQIAKDWELAKDLHRLNVEIKKKTSSRKDLADLIALKHQLLGNGKPLIENSVHINSHFPLAERLKEARERRNAALSRNIENRST